MSRSDGFILPLILILLFVLSLLIQGLYQAENTHLAVFAMVKEEQQKQQTLQNLEPLIQNAEIENQNATQITPDPSDSPIEGNLYLRSKNPDTGINIWQENLQHFMIYIQCNREGQCEIIHLHRLT